jgi:hypothetical protein
MQKNHAATAQVTLRHCATMFAFTKSAPKRIFWLTES